MLIIFIVESYIERDFKQLSDVYKSAFAEPPWDEYLKCSNCGVNYGINETKASLGICKRCRLPLKLIEFWSEEDIRKDLLFALSQNSPILLVAKYDGIIKGITWGYQLPLPKFPFLKEVIDPDSNYMDEIAVDGKVRKRGIGKLLGSAYIDQCTAPEIVLRTDERNNASMGLFSSLGFKNTGVKDPEFPYRIYLRRKRK
ncbi:GNAT family N-acetyltransferase [Candidatus Pacearchaeota archaeon]|nr:GNAT family N-acetyltransferase [Candidatus Pacearchaeota archaeon]